MMTPPTPAQTGSDTQPFDTDVLIVGAGPVGLTLANLLGGYGINTVLADAGEKLIDYPRGVGLDDESLRTFQTAGVVNQVLPHTTPNHVMRMVNGTGQVLANVAPGDQDFGWSRRNAFIQPAVDAELLQALSRFDHVHVHFSHTLLGYIDDADGVTATVELSDGTQKTIRARYLVGSDGGRSVTRKLMGVSFEGQTSPTRFLVIDLRNDPLGTPNAYLGADPVRPFVSIGLPHGVRRFEYMIFDHETDEQVADPLFVHQLLSRHVPDPAGVDFIRQRVYTLHARIAGAFRQGHVLIAGDAAHLMPVWQGQGYNSGVRDATNLAWKLTAILRGMADDALLDTYDTERRDHAKAMIDVSVAMGRILSPTNKAIAGCRDKVAAALNLVPAAKKWIAEGRYKPKPRFHVGALVESVGPAAKAQPVGSMFPQPRVDTRTEKNLLLDDVLGPWFSVLVWGNDPRHVFDQNSLETLTRLGVKLVSIRPSTQLHWDAAPTGDPREAATDVTVIGDPTGRLKSWFDTHPVGFVIVRPDRYIAAAALAQHGSSVVSSLAAAIHLSAPQTTPGDHHDARPRLDVAQPTAGALAAAG
jgi:3-(3-hydroxy-phenyl)propionate hydroxylase